jgi:hypothetical protein
MDAAENGDDVDVRLSIAPSERMRAEEETE